MRRRYPALPAIWLVSDARNDAVLERVLIRMPRGSGLIFRHYHLPPSDRRRRFDELRRLARRKGHQIALSADARTAHRWGADAAYGPAEVLARGPALPRLVTAHSLHEMSKAGRAAAIVLSPVHSTRSHPGIRSLGGVRFRLLAARSRVPVMALGGMTARRARALGAEHWAAIDGLSR
jgi:thiamine-phosphate pyrophosphorylase